jgi:hypothetical protein
MVQNLCRHVLVHVAALQQLYREPPPVVLAGLSQHDAAKRASAQVTNRLVFGVAGERVGGVFWTRHRCRRRGLTPQSFSLSGLPADQPTGRISILGRVGWRRRGRVGAGALGMAAGVVRPRSVCLGRGSRRRRVQIGAIIGSTRWPRIPELLCCREPARLPSWTGPLLDRNRLSDIHPAGCA